MNVISWFRTPNFTVKGKFRRDGDTLVPDEQGDITQYIFNNEVYVHKGEWPMIQAKQASFTVPLKTAIFVEDDTDEVHDVINIIRGYMGPKHQIENLPVAFCFGKFVACPKVSIECGWFGFRIKYHVEYTCIRKMHGTLYFTDILGRRSSCEI